MCDCFGQIRSPHSSRDRFFSGVFVSLQVVGFPDGASAWNSWWRNCLGQSSGDLRAGEGSGPPECRVFSWYACDGVPKLVMPSRDRFVVVSRRCRARTPRDVDDADTSDYSSIFYVSMISMYHGLLAGNWCLLMSFYSRTTVAFKVSPA